jgi:ferredoxin
VCPQGLIHIDPDDLRGVPTYVGADGDACIGCERCVRVCPGLAITLVDPRAEPATPLVTVPFEFEVGSVAAGETVLAVATDGAELAEVEVARVRGAPRARPTDAAPRAHGGADGARPRAAGGADGARPRAAGGADGTLLVQVRVPAALADRVAGVRLLRRAAEPAPVPVPPLLDDATVVCRCERVTAGELRALVRSGVRDVNELKARTRAEMGACGAKTCAALIDRLFREEGVAPEDVTPGVRRPPFVEVPLGVFAGVFEGVEEAS